MGTAIVSFAAAFQWRERKSFVARRWHLSNIINSMKCFTKRHVVISLMGGFGRNDRCSANFGRMGPTIHPVHI